MTGSNSDLTDLIRLKKSLSSMKQLNEGSQSLINPTSFVSQMISYRIEQEIQRLHCQNENKKLKWKYCFKRQNKSTRIRISICFIVKYVLLFVLAFLVLLTNLLSIYYRYYISPTIQAARWDGPNGEIDRLRDEFTYYNRICDEFDVTQDNLDGLIFDENKTSSKHAINTIMTHGMGIFPSLISLETASILRSYILKRNMELTTDEYIPLDAPTNRWSFGIHANEHASVADALMQLSHDKLLANTLEGLLGKDPAVVEITAISVAPGADAQGWHPDVKPLGSSVKYAQTFTHSYSLFIPLQDVTKRMGATEVCPGTHYCASEELYDACVSRGFQAAQGDTPQTSWKTGNGLVMNQKMWHRGAAYLGREGEIRVVFIVTFTSRPNFGKDHRQLSHGTYFHIHPHMYGHTFKDLKRANVTMTTPFTILRSLGVWKPWNANWGYVWSLVTSLRIATQQNGYQFEDLEMFLTHYTIAKRIPSFLHGRALDDGYGGWSAYLSETIENFKMASFVVYVFCFLIFLMVASLQDRFESRSSNHMYLLVQRTCIINLIVLWIGYQISNQFQSTQFAKAVQQHSIYAKPFVNNHENSKPLLRLPSGLSTVPERSDILFGLRHASNYIGFYLNFLDYHPGNMEWRVLIDDFSDLFSAFHKEDEKRQEIVDLVVAYADTIGRMLNQAEDGRWIVMDDNDKKTQANKALNIGRNHVLKQLDKQFNVLLADLNFGVFYRHKHSMQTQGIQFIYSLQRLVFGTVQTGRKFNLDVKDSSLLPANLFHIPKLSTWDTYQWNHVHARGLIKSKTDPTVDFQVGDLVMSNFRGSGFYLPGRVTEVEYGKYGTIEYLTDNGQFIPGEGEQSSIILADLRPYRGRKEGDRIAVIDAECELCPLRFLPATIINIHPDGTCDVKYTSTGHVDLNVDIQFVALDITE